MPSCGRCTLMTSSASQGARMSHDFALWDSDTPLEDGEAGLIYRSLVDTGSSDKVRPSAKIAGVVQEIQTRWPDPGPGREDDWPLAAPVDTNGSFVIVCIVPSRLWDVWPFLGELAKQK